MVILNSNNDKTYKIIVLVEQIYRLWSPAMDDWYPTSDGVTFGNLILC
jgi:hypothetical protein